MPAGSCVDASTAIQEHSTCILDTSNTTVRRSRFKETLKGLLHKADGTYRYSGFRQREDMKLSYAFNPYNITLDTKENKRQITLWYDFTWPEPQNAYPTYIDVGPMTLKLNDSLVYVVSDCPTYRVEQSWYIQSN